MISQRPFIKVILVSIVLATCLSISAIATIQKSQASTDDQRNQKATLISQPMSFYERKLQRELSLLSPGNKQFNPHFLKLILKNNKRNKEV